jgi:hypothetical protein
MPAVCCLVLRQNTFEIENKKRWALKFENNPSFLLQFSLLFFFFLEYSSLLLPRVKLEISIFYKSSSAHATPAFNSPMDSPSHPSYGRHSCASSASCFSGTFRSGSRGKPNRKRNDKRWPHCNVIEEEGLSLHIDVCG